MRRRPVLQRLPLIPVALGLILGGCSQEERCPCPDDRQLDEELMLVLASARAYHHQADLMLQQGDVQGAEATIRKILALNLDPRWAEAEEVRLDAAARLAKLLLGQAREAEAMSVAEEGIAASRRESFYLSNLHSVRGEILERRSKRLDAEGRAEQAKQAAREAITAFERSITINKRLQRQLARREAKP
jgi:tetratricopeptide (TPR) repeat protein